MVVMGELFCEGNEHADFNNALILTVKKAFGDGKLCFVASKSHIDALQKVKGNQNDIEYAEVNIPNQVKTTSFKRAIPDALNVLKLLLRAKKKKSSILIVSAINSQILYSLKFFLHFFSEIRCFCIPHSIILTVENSEKLSIKQRMFGFSAALAYKFPANLRVMTIGSFTRDWLIEKIPHIQNNVCSAPMAYVFGNTNDCSISENTKEVVFGFYGVATYKKGCQDFYRLAKEIRELPTKRKAKFLQIGRMDELETVPNEIKSIVEIPIPDRSLTKDEFDFYGKKVDYALILYDRKYYDILHGASAMDALNYAKPIIAYHTKFIDDLFNRGGNVGYLCDNYTQLKEIVYKIIDTNDTKQYVNQVTKIKEMRASFLPDSLAEEYKKCLSI